VKLNDKLRIALVIPKKRFLCLGGILWIQRYGPLQVASVIKDSGYEISVINEELGLVAHPSELAAKFDVIGFSAKTSAMTRAEELATQTKFEAEKIGRRVFTVLGGEHASMSEGCRVAPVFDMIYPGESEGQFLEFINGLALDEQLEKTAITFPPSGNQTGRPLFNNIPDLSVVRGYSEITSSFRFKYVRPLWIFANRRLPMLTFQGSRGCPYNCSFCPTAQYLQGNKYRRMTPEVAVDYLASHVNATNISRVIFEDPTAALPFDAASYRFFKMLAGKNLNIKATVLVRVDLSNDIELLQIMREAGVYNLSIGIESLSDVTQRKYKKNITADILSRSLNIFHDLGFSITGLFIVGTDEDGPDVFDNIEHFIKQHGVEKWRVSPLGQMPEVDRQFFPAYRFFLWSELTSLNEDLADYVNGEFVTFFPLNMKPSLLQTKLADFTYKCTSLKDLIVLLKTGKSLNSVIQRLGNNIAHRLVQKEIARSKYIDYLREIEEPFYEAAPSGHTLRKDVLMDRYRNFKRCQTMEVP
jgi:radical SAM superfamily enzyme YgiQ (UPF0313 family)